MGMYDYLHIDLKCPFCNKVHFFHKVQFKEFDCNFDNYYEGFDTKDKNLKYLNVMAECDLTNKIFELDIKVKNGVITNKPK